MDDGRVAFLDFGMTKRLDESQILLEQRAIDAASRDDADALLEALDDLGFIHNPKRIDAERLMDHVRFVGGWYLEDRELEITPKRVMKMIEVTSDPRSDFFDMVRKEALPADELMGRRMETGLLACLAQLRAKQLAPDHARVGLRRQALDGARRGRVAVLREAGHLADAGPGDPGRALGLASAFSAFSASSSSSSITSPSPSGSGGRIAPAAAASACSNRRGSLLTRPCTPITDSSARRAASSTVQAISCTPASWRPRPRSG